MSFTDSLLRPEIAALPAYTPGARPAPTAGDAAYHGPKGGGSIHSVMPESGPVKLSSNENPYVPLPAVLQAIETAAHEINRYPDLIATTLTAALADKYRVQPEQIVCGMVQWQFWPTFWLR